MARITKIELTQINSQLAADNAALRAQLGAAQADIALLRKELCVAEADIVALAEQYNEAIATVEAVSRPTQRVAQHMPAWQVARAEAMAAARAIAMSTGRSVKV